MNLMKMPTTRDIAPQTATADHAFDSRSMAADGVGTYVARQTCTRHTSAHSTRPWPAAMSTPAQTLLENYGFTVDNVMARARSLLQP